MKIILILLALALVLYGCVSTAEQDEAVPETEDLLPPRAELGD